MECTSIQREEKQAIQKKQEELIQIQRTAPRGSASVKDCLDFMSRFELKPFNLVRVFPKKASYIPGIEDETFTFALRLYARNLEVPLTYDDYEECMTFANTYWVLLRFMILDDDYKEMPKYETKILSGDYDFGDRKCFYACQPICRYLSLLPDDRNMPALFKYLTDPNCTKEDEQKALELYNLFGLPIFL